MSAEVVWQVIKKNNSFLRKGSAGRHDAVFSAEPGNLYARHSFKHSGALLVLLIIVPNRGAMASQCVRDARETARVTATQLAGIDPALQT